jgi:hypothetical protein
LFLSDRAHDDHGATVSVYAKQNRLASAVHRRKGAPQRGWSAFPYGFQAMSDEDQG